MTDPEIKVFPAWHALTWVIETAGGAHIWRLASSDGEVELDDLSRDDLLAIRALCDRALGEGP